MDWQTAVQLETGLVQEPHLERAAMVRDTFSIKPSVHVQVHVLVHV